MTVIADERVGGTQQGRRPITHEVVELLAGPVRDLGPE